MRYTTPSLGTLGLAAALVAAILGTSWGVGWILSEPADDAFPDAPFPSVEAGVPWVMSDREAPERSQQPDFEQYVAAYKQRTEYFHEHGAYSRATNAEREALDAVDKENYVRGRELAEKVLREHADSVAALLSLAQAQYLGEANLPVSLHTVRRARHLLEERGRANPRDADSREWYLRSLLLENWILSSMDRQAPALRVAELMEQLYGPLPRFKLFHLIKLERLDDAQQALAAMEASGRWPKATLNDKLILASKRRQRSACYEVASRIVESKPTSAVIWSNFAGAALGDFRFDEMERGLLKSIDCGKSDFAGTAYTPLSFLHLQQGKFAELPGDLRKLKTQHALREPYSLIHDQADVDRSLALFLLALGNARDAERFARQAYERPQRMGNNSVDAISGHLTNGVVLWSVLQAQLDQREETDFLTGTGLMARQARRTAIQTECRTLRSQILKIVGDRRRPNPLRPYLPEEVGVDSWLLGQFVQMLPTGIVREMIRDARASETHPAAAPYFDALEAEAELVAGNDAAALQLATKALKDLSTDGERLLRARTNAVAAEASRRLGNSSDHLQRLDQVLNDFPAVLRLLKIAIPVHTSADDEPSAKSVAAALLRSPRFHADPQGFKLGVKRQGKSLAVEMTRLDGSQRLVIHVDGQASDELLAAATLDRFSAKLNSPWLDLTPIDVNGLDGSPVAAMASQRIDALLDPIRPGAKTAGK